MHPKALLASFCLASTALASPLLTKRVYNIDGDKLPEPDWTVGTDGEVIPPPGFPNYDIDPEFKCQAHINYVPDLQESLWRKECEPKIYQWKVDNNIFGSRQEAAWAKKKEAEKAAKAAEAPKPAESVAPAEPALLIKRGRGPRRAPAYNMDGEVVPEPLYLDENRHIVYPEDWPYYYDDKNPEHCEPHKNYVPRIGIHKWRNQCLEQVKTWKFNHNVFANHEEAAEAKAHMEINCAPGGKWSIKYPFIDICKKYRERKANEEAEKQEREQKQGDQGSGDE